ncbi:FAD-dependent oxidoreductase [Ferrimonas lipolytica]|uniref:FAD-dependent oxidoreductase n=1 Tax=Ferrimonas lipolytica TaxID=2724191 RepID=A0A6H1UDL8_9GAMM|nr:FAD-dependent oxidoreductase [Ferrimonas lipolytica]QIZ76690.1 FAD-dependent oxidoreductase [Ferrimonas lipolytica]
MCSEPQKKSKKPRVGIIGGGVAGSTIAMQLSQNNDIDVLLLEQGQSLVNGPPFCHLHAGGNLYREIDEQQCVQLLQESIDTLKMYPHCANIRPTVIAVPQRDPGEVDALLPRLQVLTEYYRGLTETDGSNKLLGEPDDYFRLYSRAQMEQLKHQVASGRPRSCDQWMIPLAKELDFDKVKWPLVLVQEYGLSLFRLAASAELTLQQRPGCQLLVDTKVVNVTAEAKGWTIQLDCADSKDIHVDYLVNACGYRSGELDDLLEIDSPRLVEFKAAYVAKWSQASHWPEVIFHGERGTPNGMAQLTPYADGLFQLHGMTDKITLFEQGLVASSAQSAQPQLPLVLRQKLHEGWPQAIVEDRTNKAIAHLAYFLPKFAAAATSAKPLYGAQQIPGDDANLRAADVAFSTCRYARAEIVKATSAIPAARLIQQQLVEIGLLSANPAPNVEISDGLDYAEVERYAQQIALQRDYPPALARQFGE